LTDLQYTTGIVVLAAGDSSRFGSPKQMLSYNGKSMLKHMVHEATVANADAVVVVVGAYADLIVKEIEGNDIYITVNKDWQKGMASSLTTGLKALLKILPGTDAVIFMVCDQPFVTGALLNELINKHRETGQSVVACAYGETTGTPALFHQSLFSELYRLQGDAGARKIIQQHKKEMAAIQFPGGLFDIDTRQDYEKLVKT
jgi:molybdenum cofactor cytidylyltransferase